MDNILHAIVEARPRCQTTAERSYEPKTPSRRIRDAHAGVAQADVCVRGSTMTAVDGGKKVGTSRKSLTLPELDLLRIGPPASPDRAKPVRKQ